MINIAKLLKDVPNGMKLYSPLLGEVKFDCVKGFDECIIVTRGGKEHRFTKSGKYIIDITISAECLLFPSKDCRTWEGWKLPVEPRFKVGDDIKTGNTIETIAEINYATRSYSCESGRNIWFENEGLWHLAPKPHYDITNFQPFDRVLVRQNNDNVWGISWFSRCEDNEFCTCNNVWFNQCIHFEGNEHLLGTTDMPDERFINW